jgi:hypothetical protein
MKYHKSIFWIILITCVLFFLECLASIYYFQRYNHDAPFAIVQLGQGLKARLIKSGFLAPSKLNYKIGDDRVGWTNKKNIQFSPDYCGSSVTYTIGPYEERFIPSPANPIGRILFLGGSFTFGHCVNDHETYPYILATKFWRNWEARNMSSSGWGTSQAYLKLVDAINSDAPPSMVIYGMISPHVQRNYLRQSHLQVLTASLKKIPHFELVNGELIFHGAVRVPYELEEGLELRKKEYELTTALLLAMNRLCAEKNIPFFVIFLPHSEQYPLQVIHGIYNAHIQFLDLSTLVEEVLNPKDRHPNSHGHRMIANAIAHSFISDKLRSIEEQKKNLTK